MPSPKSIDPPDSPGWYAIDVETPNFGSIRWLVFVSIPPPGNVNIGMFDIKFEEMSVCLWSDLTITAWERVPFDFTAKPVLENRLPPSPTSEVTDAI